MVDSHRRVGHSGPMSTAERLLDLLRASGRPFEVLDHEPARSAEEAAERRGTALSVGAKSVVMRIDKLGFVVLVVGSDRRIEGRALRQALGVQRYRFATPEELFALAGLISGEVPAFGTPLFEATLVVGEDFEARQELVFAAGSMIRSVRMGMADWRVVACPRVVAPFTVAAAGLTPLAWGTGTE